MVLGFALCTTMAFAQTTVAHRNNSKVTAQKPDLNALKAATEQVDYKASIFTKDATFDTVFTFDFADMTGIDTAGYVQQNDVIVYNGHDSVMRANYNTVPVETMHGVFGNTSPTTTTSRAVPPASILKLCRSSRMATGG